ncbi:stalk domain-containing protein [Paenibacillus chartarius]|uniref:Stalk domain-containing protein n=1 Tax=Paenibacillus chartarius TaxID=747481 RepID=A0ABV6DKL5_9BACL
MKAQRLLTLMIAAFILSTGVVTGASMWGDYDGNAKARLFVNDEEKTFSDSEVPAFITHGSTVLPLRTLSQSLMALVRWDNSNKTVSIYKPNVQIITSSGLTQKDNNYTISNPFDVVNTSDALNFYLYASVDNLKTNIQSFKISIKTPSGGDLVEPVVSSVSSDYFIYTWQFKRVEFTEYGKYTVQFAAKLDDGSDYMVIGEKQIVRQ